MRREKEVSPDGGALSLFLSSGVSILPPPSFLPPRNDAGKENPQKILRRWPKKEGGAQKISDFLGRPRQHTKGGEGRESEMGASNARSLLFFILFFLYLMTELGIPQGTGLLVWDIRDQKSGEPEMERHQLCPPAFPPSSIAE